MDSIVVQEINKIKDTQFTFRVLIPWLGFSQKTLPYEAKKRFAGKTSYTFRKMFSLACNSTMFLTIKPLRVSLFAGIIIFLFTFTYIAYALYAKLFTNLTTSGWTSVLVSILFLGAIQLLSIGLLGEYVGQIYLTTKGSSNYIITDSVNIELQKLTL